MIHWHIIKRKIGSLISRSAAHFHTFTCYAHAGLNDQIVIAPNCQIGKNTIIRATDGGHITLGKSTALGRNVQIISRGGRIVIGDNVHIGDGSIIVAHQSIQIGTDSLIAEYVVIRDQDHETRTRPVRLAGFRTASIHIGNDVWIGAKASILRGVSVGDGAIVGAHALVRSNVPNGKLAVGVPARVNTPPGDVS